MAAGTCRGHRAPSKVPERTVCPEGAKPGAGRAVEKTPGLGGGLCVSVGPGLCPPCVGRDVGTGIHQGLSPQWSRRHGPLGEAELGRPPPPPRTGEGGGERDNIPESSLSNESWQCVPPPWPGPGVRVPEPTALTVSGLPPRRPARESHSTRLSSPIRQPCLCRLVTHHRFPWQPGSSYTSLP